MISMPKLHTSDFFKKLYDDSLLSDFTIKCVNENTIFNIHKCILASRCDSLRQPLVSNTLQSLDLDMEFFLFVIAF